MYTPGRVQLAERALDSLPSPQQQTPASAFDADRVLRVGDGVASASAGAGASATSKAAALSSARAAAAVGAPTDKGYCSYAR